MRMASGVTRRRGPVILVVRLWVFVVRFRGIGTRAVVAVSGGVSRSPVALVFVTLVFVTLMLVSFMFVALMFVVALVV